MTDPHPALATLQHANAALQQERDAALAREAALAEVLGVINASPGNLAPVFDAMLEKAMRLCGAAFGSLYVDDGEHFNSAAQHGVPSAYAAFRAKNPPVARPGSSGARLRETRRPDHVLDVMTSELYLSGNPNTIAMVELGGIRTFLSVPLLKDDSVLGYIQIYRQEVRAFTDSEIVLLRSFAAQAVIAMENARLLEELRAQTEALTQRNSEYGERIEQQSATIDVLKVMSASPGDPQPVFDLIAERARAFCNTEFSAVGLVDDGQIYLRAFSGTNAGWAREMQAAFPVPVSDHLTAGKAILTHTAVQNPDTLKDAAYSLQGLAARMRSNAAVPILRDDVAIGVIAIGRSAPGAFTDSQIELLQTFAEQAVIAISSAETFRALQARTAALALRNSEFGERIEQQSATIDVLKVMSSTPDDTEPVFNLIVRRARELCNTSAAGLFEYDGTLLHLRTVEGVVDQAGAEAFASRFPMPPGTDTVAGRTVLEGQVVHIQNVDHDPSLHPSVAALRSGGSILGVPLIRDGQPIGAITLNGKTDGGFTDSQIALLQTFAEQAVIAIGTVATYRQLQERTAALAARNREFGERIEQQAATIDVLKVMSASPGDPQPVFEQIARQARELCNGRAVSLFQVIGGLVHCAAVDAIDINPMPPAFAAYMASFPRALARDMIPCRAILDQRIIHIRDAEADLELSPLTRGMVRGRYRSQVVIPLMRDGQAIGCISLTAAEPGGFSDSRITLLQTFAEQAVIAISSAETYRELQERTAALAQRNSEFGERIEQQSATIDVLKVMSSTPDDTQPVFDLITRRAHVLCNAFSAALYEYDGTLVHWRSLSGIEAFPSRKALEDYRGQFPMLPSRETVPCRAILEKAIIHIRDVSAEPELLSVVHELGWKSGLALPLLRGEQVIGVIAINSQEVGGFTDSQVELMQTFAEQAVIAIGTVATYRELQTRTADLALRNSAYGERIEQQSATIDVLKVMSASPGDPQPVFDLIAERALAFSQSDAVAVTTVESDTLHLRAYAGRITAVAQVFRAAFPRRVDASTVQGRAILTCDAVFVEDLLNDPDFAFQALAKAVSLRALSAVPMLRGNTPIGAIAMSRIAPGLYTNTQIELVRTFAEQAVIAITSAENYRALQDRTEALTRSVAELQALEETIRSVNSSLDLDTVLATIISRAVQLSQADEGTIYEYDEREAVFVPKAAHGMSAERIATLRERRIRMGETHLGRAAAQRAPVHVSDVQQDPAVAGADGVLEGIHAVLAVPLLRDDKVIGGLVIRRRAAGDFAPSTPTLLQTFAGQSVLAIENARLFEQLAERGAETSRAREAAEAALEDLRRTQDRLVQTEKMASLGQLTAGIAHEIKNPLNFVNNFSDLSVDLLAELNVAVAADKLSLPADIRAEIDELTATLTGNLQKIIEHGRRADSIVKNMLLHSRSGASEQRATDLNALAEEALNLAYHGARAEFPGFNITLERDFDPAMGTVEILPQEISRVLVNLINNGFYAARKRAEQQPGFDPVLHLSTRNLGERVEIRVRDNGTGIPDAVRDKIFEPFFTTKPAGQGTGLGLSLSFDIVVKQHGGQLTVASAADQFTEFTILLPRQPPAAR